MAEITFYQLPQDLLDESVQRQVICRVIQKIYQVTGSVGVLCEAEDLKPLDDLLWTFSQGSFIPHAIAPSEEPVLLSDDIARIPPDRVLVLTLAQLPPNLPAFSRIVDFILPDPASVQHARQRYRAFQNQGHTLTVHQLTA
ncbi:DNA polymerase III subunit chi [Thermithiobacillus plumbiphilus]|uniref:DNA polymerase III subunit chi n=1 Tax=Thermithiobacillus plumbiphilus TaxID=1729899 RepID=A0ABU9D8I2_9PROT